MCHLLDDFVLSGIYRYLASGDLMASLAMSYRIGKSTVSSIIQDTCEAIWEVLQYRVLFQPSQENWMKIADDFFERWNFPHCIGAIDGKHVVIQAPPHAGSTFYNYKGQHSNCAYSNSICILQIFNG